MFHTLGERFEDFGEVKKRLCNLSDHWVRKLVPAVQAYAKEVGLPAPQDEDPNCKCCLYSSILVGLALVSSHKCQAVVWLVWCGLTLDYCLVHMMVLYSARAVVNSVSISTGIHDTVSILILINEPL